jgi:hypothetical protein
VINDLEPIFDVPKYMYIWDYQNRKITIPIERITISLTNDNNSAIIHRYRGNNNWDVEQIDNQETTEYNKLTNLDCGNLLCNFFKKYNKYSLNFECSILLPFIELIRDYIAKISFNKPYIRPTGYWNIYQISIETYYELSMRLV